MDSFRQEHPEYNIHNNVIRSFLKSNMEYSLKKIVHFVRPILQMVASRVLPNYKNTCFTSDQQPASRASVYTHLQNARKRHVPFPRFACWGVSAPSPKTHPENRMAARLSALIRRTIISRPAPVASLFGEASCGARYGLRFSRCVSSSRACSRASRYAA